MNKIIIIVFVFLCAATVQSAILPEEKPYYNIENAEAHFQEYLKNFQKSYETETECSRRFEIFVNNLIKINQFNDQQEHAISDVNFLTDMSEEERKALLGYRPSGLTAEPFPTDMFEGVEIPDTLDWRTNNSVTPVKDQGTCGSCWTFATTAIVESQYAMKHKKIVDLSEQQILDCDQNDSGCNGGFPSSALQYLIDAGGQMLERDYPYEEADGDCAFVSSKVAVKVKNEKAYKYINEEDMAKLVAKVGPISIGLFMSNQLMSYKKGVMTPGDCHDYNANHAVALVGYGAMDGVPYWLIKNSFGTDWGDKGYFRIRRGQKLCKINDYVTTVQIE